jgi:hypothetical protein
MVFNFIFIYMTDMWGPHQHVGINVACHVIEWTYITPKISSGTKNAF